MTVTKNVQVVDSNVRRAHRDSVEIARIIYEILAKFACTSTINSETKACELINQEMKQWGLMRLRQPEVLEFYRATQIAVTFEASMRALKRRRSEKKFIMRQCPLELKLVLSEKGKPIFTWKMYFADNGYLYHTEVEHARIRSF